MKCLRNPEPETRNPEPYEKKGPPDVAALSVFIKVALSTPPRISRRRLAGEVVVLDLEVEIHGIKEQ